MINKMLGNRYEILEKLGGGGMAIVYKGKDTYLNRLVTIKILRPEFTTDEDFIRRFRREAQAVASLSHPNIVNIHDVGQEEGVHYLVMEYVPGDNLKEIIKQNGHLNPEQAVRFAIQICAALEHAHQNKIVHRDVKPHNILVTNEGKAKLTDFGIAMEATTSTLTRTDTIMGSVHYLSPEQARGEIATPRSDIYAVGILLYEMLTGEKPYSGETPIAVALKHIQETPRPIMEVNPEVPAELASIVMRAIEKNPEMRYQSADELARHLDSSLDDDQATVLLPAEELTRRIKDLPDQQERDIVTADKARIRLWSWVAVIVLLSGLMAGGVYGFYNLYMNVPEVKVPSVIGHSFEEAKEELEALGLQVKEVEKHDEQDEGLVIAQDIGPDDPPVKPPRLITLTVSLGAESTVVPGLYGTTTFEAERRLREAGLVTGQTRDIFHPELEEGRIVESNPAEGTRVDKGTSVQLILSKGPENKTVTVPDLTGKTLDQARETLTSLNLELDENQLEWDYSPEHLRGRVIGQNPSAGSDVQEGTQISVVLNNSPGPVQRQATVKIEDEIPNDGLAHLVEIIVNDLEGRKVQYTNTHTYGDKINKRITYVGQGTVQVLIDGKQIMEGELK